MQRYNDLHQHAAPNSTRVRKSNSRHNTSRLNIDDTDTESDNNDDDSTDPNRPWLDEWTMYFNTHEAVPDGMGIVHWWGVCLTLFPV